MLISNKNVIIFTYFITISSSFNPLPINQSIIYLDYISLCKLVYLPGALMAMADTEGETWPDG